MCVCVYLLWFLILDGRFFLLCWYSTNISKFIKIYTEFGFKKRMTVILLTVPEMCLLQLSPHWYGTECCWWLTWLLFRFWTTIYPYWSGVAPKLAPWSKSMQNLACKQKKMAILLLIVTEMRLIQFSPQWYGGECWWWLACLLLWFWTTVSPSCAGVAPKWAPW